MLAKKFLFFLILLGTQIFNNPGYGQEAKNYVPPSPNAMTFLKYGDYPVDYSTGVPSINIPIYTIGLKDYSFPISASFHASGRNTSLNYSSLGLNWALNATGVISREIKGKPDGLYQHPEKQASYYEPHYQHRDELLNMENPRISGASGYEMDSEYDIFSLSINGISAKFIIRDNNQVIFLTYCSYTIAVTKPTYNSYSFLLTDDKGVKYNFGYTETATGIGETSWFISSIITPSGSAISFKYGSQSTFGELDEFLGDFNYPDLITIGDGLQYYFGSAPPSQYSSASVLKRTNTSTGTDYYISYIKEIDFDNGKIFFTYNPTSLLLQEVKVLSDPDQKVVKDVFFSFYPYLPGTNLGLANNNSKTIQDIRFKDESGNEMEKYHFDYYQGKPGGTQADFSTSKDWWGYSNGARNYGVGTNAIPVSSIQINTNGPAGEYTQQLGGSSSHRDPVFAEKVVGMIRRIYYPTGGNSEFLYESNFYDYDGNGTSKEGPGIRIKQIKSNDGFGNQTSKVYKYGNNENGMGTLMWRPSGEDYFTMKVMNFINVTGGHDPIDPIDYASYRWRVYSAEPQLSDIQQALHLPVYYSSVTEYNSSLSNLSANGKTTFTYSNPSYATPYTSMTSLDNFYFKSFRFDSWSAPQLTGKSIFKFDIATGTYKIQSTTANTYVKLNEVSIPQSIVYRFHEFPTDNTSNRYSELFVMTPRPGSTPVKVFYLLDKPIISAVLKPLAETTTIYDDNGVQLSSSINYEYNNLVHCNPTGITTVTSDNKKSTTYISYAGNLSYPEEKVITKSEANGTNTTILSGEIYTYAKDGILSKIYKLEMPSPVSLASFKFSTRATGLLPNAGSTPTAFLMDSRYKPKTTYSLFDTKYNPLLITPESDFPISYIWGYNNAYPVAEVKNALTKNIFHNNFENLEGNSTSGDSKTGLLSRTGGYTKSLSGLDNGTYILSYWLKSGGVWTFQSNSNIAVSSGTYTINISGQIDDVRFYPVSTFMTTYTYLPLIGMSSATDVNNKTTYYEYDNAKRLQNIKDENRNILKQYSYSFINPSFYSAEKSGVYVKQGCGATLLGSSVNYIVPEGTYTSNISQQDADAKAGLDVNNKGQAYANANGYCFNYKNYEIWKDFTTTCDAGLYGKVVRYTVPYERFNSIISQEDAQAKALNDLNTNGPVYAQLVANGGGCLTYAQVFKSAAVTQTLTKACPAGYTGAQVAYVAPYAKFISTINQLDADHKVIADILAKQDEINNSTSYSCTPLPTTSIQVSNTTHYDMSISISGANGYFSYTAVHDQSYGTMTVPQGTYTISISSPNSNTYHFYLGGVQQQGSSASYYNVQPANISITN